MVRKSITIVFVVLAAVMLSVTASAASVYDGNISTTYITIYRDISSNIGIDDDYVMFRSGQYDYTMFVGDLTLTGTTFRSDKGQLYVISTNNGNYGNGTYVYTVSETSNFSLNAGNALVYSNLGHYPDLIERVNDYEMASVLLVCIGLCCYLLRSIFGFCLRRRV